MIILELPYAPPSLNQLMAWKYREPYRYKRFKAETEQLIELRLAEQKMYPPPKAQAKRRVSFIRFSAGELDDDNLRGGFKPVRDALKTIGLIRDDNARWLEAHYAQVKVKPGAQSMRIEISEAV